MCIRTTILHPFSQYAHLIECFWSGTWCIFSLYPKNFEILKYVKLTKFFIFLVTPEKKHIATAIDENEIRNSLIQDPLPTKNGNFFELLYIDKNSRKWKLELKKTRQGRHHWELQPPHSSNNLLVAKRSGILYY